LGPAEKVSAQIGPDGRIATTLAGTTVKFDGRAAPILSAKADEIVCIVPLALAETSPWVTTMQVQRNGERSNGILLPDAWSGVEILAVVNADGVANSADHPAAPGSIVTVYAAGFGNPDRSVTDGTINGAASQPFTPGSVMVGFDGNVDLAEIVYAGPAPGQVAGIMQVNFRVPQKDAGGYNLLVGYTKGSYDIVTITVGK